MLRSDKPFKNEVKNTIHVFQHKKPPFSKLPLICEDFVKMFYMRSDHLIHRFPTVYYAPHFDKKDEVQRFAECSSTTEAESVR